MEQQPVRFPALDLRRAQGWAQVDGMLIDQARDADLRCGETSQDDLPLHRIGSDGFAREGMSAGATRPKHGKCFGSVAQLLHVTGRCGSSRDQRRTPDSQSRHGGVLYSVARADLVLFEVWN